MFAKLNYAVYLYSKLYNYTLTSQCEQDVFSTHDHPVIYHQQRSINALDNCIYAMKGGV
jgi:hypothetical protein